MKILLCSDKGDGAWFQWQLSHEGHEVDWTCRDEKYANSLHGIIPPPLKRVPNPAAYDLVVYDASGMGESADYARTKTPTIGGSSLADRLEEDRIFGIEFMEAAGIRVPDWEAFDSKDKAIAWLEKNHKRTVVKPVGEFENKALTYVSKNSEDMIRFLEKMPSAVHTFVLQEFIEGTEVSTEAWWTGTEWVALNHTLEEKKFMAGGIGPNTGCAGNVLWMPAKKNAIFEQGLERAGALLAQTDFVGAVDLNTIVTEGEIYGLEWTPRFGYEGTCNLTRLLPIPFGDFLYKVALGQNPNLGLARAKFAATIRISVPPYPNAETSRTRNKVPIKGIDINKLDTFVLYDVVMDEKGELSTEGNYNAIGTPIGCGETIVGALDEVKAAIKRLDIPDLQWRNDVDKCINERYGTLQTQGWLRPIG